MPMNPELFSTHVLERLWKLSKNADNHPSAAGGQWEFGKVLRIISCTMCTLGTVRIMQFGTTSGAPLHP